MPPKPVRRARPPPISPATRPVATPLLRNWSKTLRASIAMGSPPPGQPGQVLDCPSPAEFNRRRAGLAPPAALELKKRRPAFADKRSQRVALCRHGDHLRRGL